ncbi:kelch-like protein [Pectobacterium phage vB_PcaM_CBB]|uniref:Kelch-like protein n=1 Tax=Pectobacterium phage vB_PcaM_CBB TaxID=2772511 RepID=A0A1L2CVU1_9CAUD|nr:kelch-like protein [Pectobacterium phage vB_PcaM_CBB]AMM44117.1 kelch-like protein [Pectobacterium phage vB_PcaM_CBB]
MLPFSIVSAYGNSAPGIIDGDMEVVEPQGITLGGTQLYGHMVCSVQSDIYICGGWNGTQVTNNLYRYSTIDNTMHQLSSMPEVLYGTTSTYYNSHIYLYGGVKDSNGTQVSDKLYRYSIESDTWDVIVTTNSPGKLSQAMIYFVNIGETNYFYIWAADLYNGMYRIDISTWTWEELTFPPLKLSYSTGTAYNNYKLYGIGNSNLYIYDMLSDTWSTASLGTSELNNSMLCADSRYLYSYNNGKYRILKDIEGNLYVTISKIITVR